MFNDLAGLTYFVVLVGVTVYFVRKTINTKYPRNKVLVEENAALRKQVRELKGQLETAQIMADHNSINNPDFDKYRKIVEMVRTAVMVYDNSKGRVSAAHTLALFKESLIRYKADVLNMDTEDRDELDRRINEHVANMNAHGFRTS